MAGGRGGAGAPAAPQSGGGDHQPNCPRCAARTRCTATNSFLLVDLLPVGSRAALTCQFRLPHNQFMDSVKWYLNQSEIYRIVPSLAQDRQVAWGLILISSSELSFVSSAI